MFGYLRPRGDTKCLNSQVCCLLVCRTCENYTRRWNKSVNMFKFLRRSTTALLVIRHTINDGGWGGGYTCCEMYMARALARENNTKLYAMIGIQRKRYTQNADISMGRGFQDIYHHFRPHPWLKYRPTEPNLLAVRNQRARQSPKMLLPRFHTTHVQFR